MRVALAVLAAALVASAPAAAQSTAKKPAAKKPAQSTAKPTTPQRIAAPADVACPHVLGTGVSSRLQFCDVFTGRDPAEGILVHLPAHKGPLTLTFDLHNRHTYSESTTKSGKAYARYTATIGVLAADGTLLARGVVQSEFRTAKDLLDRIGGGAGPKGVKAVAPIGTERISIEVPEEVTEVSLLGEKLTVMGLTGTETFVGLQRPIASVSNVNVEYQPAPKTPPKPARKTPIKK